MPPLVTHDKQFKHVKHCKTPRTKHVKTRSCGTPGRLLANTLGEYSVRVGLHLNTLVSDTLVGHLLDALHSCRTLGQILTNDIE